ncbi:MAG: IS66 family transposase [Limisphaerales bacterium]
MMLREKELVGQLAECQEALRQSRHDNQGLHRENELLRQKIELLIRRVFGSSSERLDKAQLELLLQLSESSTLTTEAVPSTVAVAPKRSCKQRTLRLPENLPVVEEVIEPELVKQKPDDWRCIGQEVSEQLDYEPARFLRRRTVRRKYVHRLDLNRAPAIAPLPERLLDRSLPAPGLLAQILVGKYCDHLPLYRQEQIFLQRHRVHLPRQTLARWVELAADWLKPIYEHIRTGVMAGGYVQVDETPIDYLEPGHGKTKQGYLWTANRPGGDVFYCWQTSRAAACLDDIVPANFTGIIQSDGYAAYRAFANGRSGIELAGCWAHVRRKFYEALEPSPRTGGWLLRQIQNLYRIEAGLREQGSGPRLRQAVRAAESRPVVKRLQRALLRLKSSGRYLPQSLLAQAIEYALGQWPTLEVYLDEGRVELDNNLVENAIRPTALGKKNWLFIGDADAGGRSAIIYTLIENCRRRGLNPFTYLRDVLTRLPNMTNHQIHEVTPQAWSKR